MSLFVCVDVIFLPWYAFVLLWNVLAVFVLFTWGEWKDHFLDRLKQQRKSARYDIKTKQKHFNPLLKSKHKSALDVCARRIRNLQRHLVAAHCDA